MAEITQLQYDEIKWALENLAQRITAYKLYDDYYNGDHRALFLASAEYQSTFSSLVGRFSENLCATVIDTLKDRLKLTDFTHDDGKDEAPPALPPAEPLDPAAAAERAIEASAAVVDPIAEAVLEIWKANKMDQLQGELYLETLKSGDGYVLVWPNELNEPEIVPNEAALVTVQYSDIKRNVIDKAAKLWITNDNYGRLNLYYVDRTEKFITREKIKSDTSLRAEAYVVLESSNGDSSTVPNPYGRVPVFHFANNASVGHFGVSELKAAIPSQDRLNKTIVDSLVVGEEHSLPVRYAIGYETPKDPRTGEPILNWKPGDWFITRQKEAQIGQLAGANMDQFVSSADDARLAIARVTRTPMHYFQPRRGTPPSGESLKTEEAPLTSKVRDRQIAFGNVWESVFKFALQIAGHADVELEAVWANTEPRDDTALINQQVQKVDHLGFSKQQALRELEYSEDEIKKIAAEKKVEAATAAPPPFAAANGQQQPPPFNKPAQQPMQDLQNVERPAA